MFRAQKAVDGKTDPVMNHRHCAHPYALTGTNAWWMVDFGEKYNTSRVVIYNRGDCCEYNSDTMSTHSPSVLSRPLLKGPFSIRFLLVSFQIHFAKNQTYLVSTATRQLVCGTFVCSVLCEISRHTATLLNVWSIIN